MFVVRDSAGSWSGRRAAGAIAADAVAGKVGTVGTPTGRAPPDRLDWVPAAVAAGSKFAGTRPVAVAAGVPSAVQPAAKLLVAAGTAAVDSSAAQQIRRLVPVAAPSNAVASAGIPRAASWTPCTQLVAAIAAVIVATRIAHPTAALHFDSGGNFNIYNFDSECEPNKTVCV